MTTFPKKTDISNLETPHLYLPREGDSRSLAVGYDLFWPGDPPEDHVKVEFPGKYITVLNDYLPGLIFEAAAVFYSLTPQDGISFGVLTNPLRVGRIIPIEAGMQKYIEGGFSHLYRTRALDTIVITNLAQFTFSYLKYVSTPVIVVISQELTNIVPSKVFPKYFKYVVDSVIPTTAGDALIDCYHGFDEIVEIAVVITGAVNPIEVKVSQLDEYSNAYVEFDIFPSAFPYYNLLTLPHKNSSRTQVYVAGGGAAETQKVSITFTLKPRA